MTDLIKKMRSIPEGYLTVRWGQPEYTDWIDESMSWKETCYIGDWSFLWERRFKGPDVLKLFSDVSVNSFAKSAIGQAKHVIHCNDVERLFMKASSIDSVKKNSCCSGEGASGSIIRCC
jgi:vanillate/3-O-methylgallate O-demethylase